MNVHVHIYAILANGDTEDDPIEELDLECRDEYENPDGYKQYGFRRNGEWIEIRVPL